VNREKTIVDYGRIIYRRRWVVIILLAAILGFTLANSLLTPKGYTARAVIFPTTSDQSGIASLLSSSLRGVMKQDASVLIVLFKSMSIAQTVTRKLGLENYFPRSGGAAENKVAGLERTAAFLRSRIGAYVDKDGAIEVKLEVRDPRLAEEIVKNYIVSVSEYLNDNSIPIRFVIIDPARASGRPSSPNLKMNLVAAFIVSIVLGISFSLLDDYFRVVLKT
jgi:uncharacterized protein involved in exopolysaccharide biosynthesis